jgi:hypothetical protein
MREILYGAVAAYIAQIMISVTESFNEKEINGKLDILESVLCETKAEAEESAERSEDEEGAPRTIQLSLRLKLIMVMFLNGAQHALRKHGGPSRRSGGLK